MAATEYARLVRCHWRLTPGARRNNPGSAASTKRSPVPTGNVRQFEMVDIYGIADSRLWFKPPKIPILSDTNGATTAVDVTQNMGTPLDVIDADGVPAGIWWIRGRQMKVDAELGGNVPK